MDSSFSALEPPQGHTTPFHLGKKLQLATKHSTADITCPEGLLDSNRSYTYLAL